MANKYPDIPPKEDKEFWGDAEYIEGIVEKIKADKKHKWIKRGMVAECISCPMTHAQYLKENQTVIDGKIVAKGAS
jgi:hypothetical protein